MRDSELDTQAHDSAQYFCKEEMTQNNVRWKVVLCTVVGTSTTQKKSLHHRAPQLVGRNVRHFGNTSPQLEEARDEGAVANGEAGKAARPNGQELHVQCRIRYIAHSPPTLEASPSFPP